MGEYLNYHGLGHFKERDDDRYIRKNEVYDIPWLVNETSICGDDDLVLIGKISDKGMYATTVSNLSNSVIGNTDISGIGDGTVTGAILTNNNNISSLKDNIDLSLKDYLPLSGGELTGNLTINNTDVGVTINTTNSSGLYFTQTGEEGTSATLDVEQQWSNHHISLHIGSGGYNRGVYDNTTDHVGWIVYKDEDDAIHLGTGTVGSSSTPIYLSGGIPKASSTTIGGAAKPMYLNSGVMTACSQTVGSGVIPVYMSSGTITASTSTVGSATKPIYMTGGTLTASGSTVGSAIRPVYLNSGTITTCNAFSTIFTVSTFASSTISRINAGDNQEFTISVSKTNYTALGIVGYNMSGTRAGLCNIRRIYLSGSTANIYVRNVGESESEYTEDFTITIYVLFMQTTA